MIGYLKEKEKNIFLAIISLLAGVAAILIIGTLMILFSASSKEKVINSRKNKNIYEIKQYQYIQEKDKSAPAGYREKYIFNLHGRIESDTILAFYIVHQYADVWIDGEKVYSAGKTGVSKIVKTPGSNWVTIPLYNMDENKEVTIEVTPVYKSFINRKTAIFMGAELAIYREQLYKDMPQLLLSMLCIFVGIMFVIVSGYNEMFRHRGKELIYLGIFSIMIGVWRFTDTRFTTLMSPDLTVMLYYISMIMMMVAPIPLVQWVKYYFNDRIFKIFDYYCLAVLINCIVQFMLQLTGSYDIRQMLLFTHIIIAIGAVVILGAYIYERIKNTQRKYAVDGMKLPYLCIAGIICDVIAFYIKGNSSGLIFSLSGFLIYITCMGIRTIFSYGRQELKLAEQEHELAEKDRLLAEKERSLTKRRIASMMSQIKSHFIFNVLTTISGYCKIDPQKADMAVITFSRYLRKNIKIIEEEGMIDFEVELEQLEDYVKLEQLRFEDMITFKKNIGVSDFMIPPLTIQPIVENAIKHGLIENNICGIIEVATGMEDNEIVITVKDNGGGFDKEEVIKSDSVGIRNVRYRLEKMTGGSLNIESTPGRGTTAVIKIPCLEEKNDSNVC